MAEAAFVGFCGVEGFHQRGGSVQEGFPSYPLQELGVQIQPIQATNLELMRDSERMAESEGASVTQVLVFVSIEAAILATVV